jgi:hypothetical protein
MTNNTNGQAVTLPEAPASVTLEIEYRGFPALFTLRAASGRELLAMLDAAIVELDKRGAQPMPRRGGGKPKGPPPQQAPADGSAPICRIHGRPMKQSQYGGWFCSQKDEQGQYCPQKAR